MHEGIPILDCLVPKAFLHESGKLIGMTLREGARGARREGPAPARADRRARAGLRLRRRAGRGRPGERVPVDRARRRHRLRRMGHAGARHRPRCSRRLPHVFFGGDAAFGPKNIIWAVAQGHAAAISIDKFLHGEDVPERPAAGVTLVSQKMGIHEWSYDNAVTPERAPQGAVARRQPDAEEHQGRGRARLRRGNRVEGSAALPQLRRADGVHARASASSATPASTSARRTASPSPPMATRPTCARDCARRHVTRTQDLYVSDDAEDRSRDGQGRGRLPALRPVRRALPDRRLGHAEVRARADAAPGCRRLRAIAAAMPADRMTIAGPVPASHDAANPTRTR